MGAHPNCMNPGNAGARIQYWAAVRGKLGGTREGLANHGKMCAEHGAGQWACARASVKISRRFLWISPPLIFRHPVSCEWPLLSGDWLGGESHRGQGVSERALERDQIVNCNILRITVLVEILRSFDAVVAVSVSATLSLLLPLCAPFHNSNRLLFCTCVRRIPSSQINPPLRGSNCVLGLCLPYLVCVAQLCAQVLQSEGHALRARGQAETSAFTRVPAPLDLGLASRVCERRQVLQNFRHIQ